MGVGAGGAFLFTGSRVSIWDDEKLWKWTVALVNAANSCTLKHKKKLENVYFTMNMYILP